MFANLRILSTEACPSPKYHAAGTPLQSAAFPSHETRRPPAWESGCKVRPGCRPWSNIKPTSGEHRRWPPATADFSPLKTSGRQKSLGVKKVALPARGRLSAKRAKQQKQRWFRRGLRWRAGIEATISTLKHPFSMARATYKGGHGFERYVGWCGDYQESIFHRSLSNASERP